KRIFYIVAFLLTVGMGANAQTLIERSDGTFTQGDQYLAALKTLSIPYGVAPTFDGGLARNGSLFFNTTTNKLMIWTGEAWDDVGKDTDLSDYYNKSEVDALIAPFATTADMNAALSLKVNTNTTVNGKALSGNITIEQSDIPGLVAALDGKANTSHTHNASDINAGILNIARIPTGTTGSTVALGNHTHTFAQITNKPNTLAGYGITNAYTKSEVNGLIPAPQTLSLVDSPDISISGGNTIALHSLRQRNIGWDVSNNGRGYFNTSSVGNPSGGSTVHHGIVIPHGGNNYYGTSIAFRNNRGYFQSFENGVLQPWVE